MPRWSKVLTDANGKFLGRVCGSSPFRKCSVPECRQHATIQCDYPVAGKRKSTTCDRWICTRHAKPVGDDLDWCPVHVRANAEASASFRLEDLAPPGAPETVRQALRQIETVQLELGLAPPDLPRERWKL